MAYACFHRTTPQILVNLEPYHQGFKNLEQGVCNDFKIRQSSCRKISTSHHTLLNNIVQKYVTEMKTNSQCALKLKMKKICLTSLSYIGFEMSNPHVTEKSEQIFTKFKTPIKQRIHLNVSANKNQLPALYSFRIT